MTRKGKTAWVLTHCDIMGDAAKPHVDSLAWHVSSSLRKAEKYICSTIVSPTSWWEIREFQTDCPDRDNDDKSQLETVRYYSHKGARIACAPWNRAVKAFKLELNRKTPRQGGKKRGRRAA